MADKPTYTNEQLTQMLRDNAYKMPYALRQHIDIPRLKAVLRDTPLTPEEKAAGTVADVPGMSRDTVEIIDPDTFAAHPYQMTVHEVGGHIVQNGLSPEDYKKFPPIDDKDRYNYGGTQGLEAGRAAGNTIWNYSPEQGAEILQYKAAHDEGYDKATPEAQKQWNAIRPTYQAYEDDMGKMQATPYDDGPIQKDTDPRLTKVQIPQPDEPALPAPSTPQVLSTGTFHATNVYAFGDPAPGDTPRVYSADDVETAPSLSANDVEFSPSTSGAASAVKYSASDVEFAPPSGPGGMDMSKVAGGLPNTGAPPPPDTSFVQPVSIPQVLAPRPTIPTPSDARKQQYAALAAKARTSQNPVDFSKLENFQNTSGITLDEMQDAVGANQPPADPLHGVGQVGTGAVHLAEARHIPQAAQAGTEILGGAMEAGAPLLGTGMLRAPLQTAAGLGAGWVTGKVAQEAAKAHGYGPEVQEFVKTAGFFIPAALGVGAANRGPEVLPAEGEAPAGNLEASKEPTTIEGQVAPSASTQRPAAEAELSAQGETLPPQKATAGPMSPAAEAASAAAAKQAQIPGFEEPAAGVSRGTSATAAPGAEVAPNAPNLNTDAAPALPVEPETGRPILHNSDDAEALRQEAKEQAPALQDKLEQAVQGIPGAQVEAVRDEKAPERVEEKADGGKPVETQPDHLAARITADTPEAKEQVAAKLAELGEVQREDNYDKTGGPNDFRADTHQIVVNPDPNAALKTAEVQVLTPEQHEAAEKTHKLYEQQRTAAANGETAKANYLGKQLARANNDAAKAAAERQAEPKFKYGSTQANLPRDSEAHHAIEAVRSRVDDADLAGDGKAIGDNHVTVRYGIQDDATGDIRKFLEQQPPFQASLAKTSSFPPSENSDGAAVLKADVQSPELERLNREIEQHGNFTKSDFDYHPHVTIAYVKPEAIGKYTGQGDTDGKTFPVTSIAITDRNGKPEQVKLAGQPAKSATQGGSGETPEPGGAGITAPRPNGQVPAGEVGRMPTSELHLDPKRFQYKLNTDASGVTDLLKGKRWNENLAETISVWRDPDDGKVYVVNGHHRAQLAAENRVPSVNVQMLDVPSAKAARAVGALQNIASGRGTAMDAAKFFRDSEYTANELESQGVSMGEATVANGMALARLNPHLFDDAVSGKLRPNRAIAIGRATANATDQDAIFDLIRKAEAKGRKVSDDTIDELARMVQGAGQHTETQESLFGPQEMTRNLALEKAEVSSYIRDQIGQEKRLFAGVSSENKAARLGKHGNIIDAGKNAEIAKSAAQAQELYDRLSTRAGGVDAILNRAAHELAEGKESPHAVKSRAYEDARAELATTLARGADSGAAGVSEKPVQQGNSQQPNPSEPLSLKEEFKKSLQPKKEAAKWETNAPVMVTDASGMHRVGRLAHFNDGANGSPRRGRITLADGKKLDGEREENLTRVAAPEMGKRNTHDPREAELQKRYTTEGPQFVAQALHAATLPDGRISIATDAVKDLIPEFKQDPIGNDRLVASSASAVARAMLKTVLDAPVRNGRDVVRINTASPGSGKTLSLKTEPSHPQVGIELESILDDKAEASQLMQQILASGRTPEITWIYVDDPAKTVDRMIARAVGHDGQPGIGRTVALKYMAHAYTEVPKVLEALKQEFGDKIRMGVIDNSGKPGTAVYTDQLSKYTQRVTGTEAQNLETMYAKYDKLDAEGKVPAANAKAATVDESHLQRTGSGEPARGSAGGGDAEAAGQPAGRVLGEKSGRQDVSPDAGNSSATVRVPAEHAEADRTDERRNSDTAAPVSRPSANEATAAEYRKQVEAAQKSSLKENIILQRSTVETVAGRKAVVLDADGLAVWHRALTRFADDLGAGKAWRGATLEKPYVNRAILLLRAQAGSALQEPGGKAAATGYERMIRTLEEAKDENGTVTLLRGDYRPDTAREEAVHAWQIGTGLDKSEAMREVAARPEFTETAHRLREMGYDVKGSNRNELASEMMAKALAGDPDLKATDAQRYDLVHAFLSRAVDEHGPEILKNLPPMAAEDHSVQAAIQEARRTYDSDGGQDAGGAEPETRGAVREGVRQAEPGTRGRDSLARGAGGQPAAADLQPGAAGTGEEEGELGPRYQRGKRLPGEVPLPGMEESVAEQDEAAAAQRGEDLTEQLRAPGKNISKAAGEMERNSPLFAGTEASGQGSLFQREDKGTETSDTAKSLDDLISGMKEMTKGKMSMADHIEESLGRSIDSLKSTASATEKAVAALNGSMAGLWRAYTDPPEFTDFKRAAGNMQLGEAIASQGLQKFSDEIQRVAPKEEDRIALTHWVEANGNPNLLKNWYTRTLQEERGINPERLKPDVNLPKDKFEKLLRRAQNKIEPINHRSRYYKKAMDLTPEQKEMGTKIQQYFQDQLRVAKKEGLLELGARNYVMHMYEHETQANLLNLIATDELNPNPGFIQHRIFRNFFEAENAGEVPKTKDIGHLVAAYHESFAHAIESRQFIRSLLDAKAGDGRPIAAMQGPGQWITANDDQLPTVLQQRPRPENLADYKIVDAPQLRNFLWEPTVDAIQDLDPKLFEDDPDRLAFKGNLVIHPQYAGRIQDMVTPSWFEKNPVGRGILKASSLAKELMTFASPFHQVQIGIHSMEHGVNPFKLPPIDLKQPNQADLVSHGLRVADIDAEGLFDAKLMKGLLEPVPGLNRLADVAQSYSHYLFTDYIPRVKMKMASDALERNQKRYNAKYTPDEILELTAKQANAAFGGLNHVFDAVPRTRTFQSLTRLAAFAPDFLEARTKFAAQALRPSGREQLGALVRGALIMYVGARVLNALLNQGDAKWDPEHAFSVVANGKSYSLRTVQGDLLHAATDPRSFIYNRLNPLTARPTIEFLTGRDQYGRQKSVTSQGKDLSKSVLPFGVQKVMQTNDEHWLDSVLTSSGINASNYRTPTEERVHKLYLASIPDLPDDPERQASNRKNTQNEDKLRSGHMTSAQLWQQVKEGKISAQTANRTMQRAQRSRLQNEYTHLHLRDAIDVYEKASLAEKMELKPLLERKAQAQLAEMPPEERTTMYARVVKAVNAGQEATP